MGKSTTVKTIMGLLSAKRGRVRFKGAEIQCYPSYRVARLGVGLVPEGREIFPTLTVRENLVATGRREARRGVHAVDTGVDLRDVSKAQGARAQLC